MPDGAEVFATTLITIEGNNTLQKNPGVVCHGIDFQTNRQDLTDFTHVHFDFYITDTDLVGDVFNFKLVNFNGGNSESSALEVNINGGTTPQLVANEWVSVDVPITALGGVVAGSLARNDIAQIGITTAMVDNVWYDNIYLHKNTLSVSSFETSNIKMYPNPASTNFTIEAQEIVSNVSVYNVLGQEVVTNNPNNNQATIDISSLQTGIYVVKATINGNVSTSRIVKK
ncbi:T9SS type A sorting domain-containing protein [Flavobacterium piscinae]|uniref:T9SS type A sorting domain-containing protein n=1 Tax=Flavobacterium piscinae TaxID=2506424 RepID=UPI0019CF10E3|nr:T9SS type A sorting domain-containing protein [Flavobacterium piscinae]MBC8884331.1 T9SS type A sorting domain-containing protein [Flavobacterium piscinae]